MKKRGRVILRHMGTLAGAGVLLQAGGCTATLSDVGQALLAGTVGNLLTSFVFGAFNIPLSSGFGF